MGLGFRVACIGLLGMKVSTPCYQCLRFGFAVLPRRYAGDFQAHLKDCEMPLGS